MNEEAKNALLARMQSVAASAYVQSIGLPGDAAVSPSLITTILGIITSLLGSCGTVVPAGLPGASAIKASATNPGLFQQLRVRQAVAQSLREQYGIGGWIQHNGAAVVSTIFAMGASASPEDILAAMQLND